MPDGPFHDWRASKYGWQVHLCSSEKLNEGFWGFKIINILVGKERGIQQYKYLALHKWVNVGVGKICVPTYICYGTETLTCVHSDKSLDINFYLFKDVLYYVFSIHKQSSRKISWIEFGFDAQRLWKGLSGSKEPELPPESGLPFLGNNKRLLWFPAGKENINDLSDN